MDSYEIRDIGKEPHPFGIILWKFIRCLVFHNADRIPDGIRCKRCKLIITYKDD